MDKKNTRWVVGLLAVVMLVVTYGVPSVQADPHTGQSKYVAILGSNTIYNGGSLPIGTNASFTDFSFYIFPRGNLSLANLTDGTICGGNACDTLVLNVSSSYSSGGLGCSTSYLSASQKTDINSFAAAGGKVIIYDSECTPSVDYSWLDYPFNTRNPGATGSSGKELVIAENNILSHSDSTNVHYINAPLTNSSTDAVGDMNVVDLTTVDEDWCLDLTGINVRNYAGATHMYVPSGSGSNPGLIIYNGLDVDVLRYYTVPTATTGAGNLAKLWLQELQAASPTLLASSTCVGLQISLNPLTATNIIDPNVTPPEHTVTATVSKLGTAPISGVEVTFTVLSGPNAGATGTCSANADCTTDADGNVSFTYMGSSEGIDEIQACYFDADLNAEVCSRIVEKAWVLTQVVPCFVDNDDDIDIYDIRAILDARGTVVVTADARDADFDGVITALDAKICIAQCTNPRCVSSN